jgi:AcrR family transcriptional regulator
MRASRSLQHRKQDLVRSAIWDAAVTLFADKGFDETTVDEVARAAGVSRRSFFRYFSSKSDLMGQGIVTYGDMITEAIAACPRSLGPLEVMRRTVGEVTVTAAAHPRVRKVAQIACTSVAAREAQLSRLAEVEDRVADAYSARRAMDAGDDLAPRLLAELTLSILDVTFREWLKRDHQDIAPTTERVFATLLHLVGAGPAPRRTPRRPKS